MIIAIDGPAGAGKSTVAKKVAEKLGFRYLDTGAMYRAVTARVLQENVSLSDVNAILKIAGTIDYSNIDEKIIRQEQISRYVSEIAKISSLRTLLQKHQRLIAHQTDIVADGRDIGSVVFPSAELKIYLDANLEERSKRRFLELKKKGINTSLEKIKENILIRDKNDMAREASPLVKLPEAIVIDTTGCSVSEVVNTICKLAYNYR